MIANPKPSTEPNRITGPAGVRLLVSRGGGWSIQHESGPRDDDPFEETRGEALAWATEIVNAKGAALHATPQRQPSPNERHDALAKATPRPPGVIGRYEYAAEDRPLKRSRR